MALSPISFQIGKRLQAIHAEAEHLAATSAKEARESSGSFVDRMKKQSAENSTLQSKDLATLTEATNKGLTEIKSALSMKGYCYQLFLEVKLGLAAESEDIRALHARQAETLAKSAAADLQHLPGSDIKTRLEKEMAQLSDDLDLLWQMDGAMGIEERQKAFNKSVNHVITSVTEIVDNAEFDTTILIEDSTQQVIKRSTETSRAVDDGFSQMTVIMEGVLGRTADANELRQACMQLNGQIKDLMMAIDTDGVLLHGKGAHGTVADIRQHHSAILAENAVISENLTVLEKLAKDIEATRVQCFSAMEAMEKTSDDIYAATRKLQEDTSTLFAQTRQNADQAASDSHDFVLARQKVQIIVFLGVLVLAIAIGAHMSLSVEKQTISILVQAQAGPLLGGSFGLHWVPGGALTRKKQTQAYMF